MKRLSIFTFLLSFFLFLFASCSPELTIQAKDEKGADLSIKTQFAPDDELRALLSSFGLTSQTAESSSFFSSTDLKSFLSQAGFEKCRAQVGQDGSISALGSCSDLSQPPLSTFNLISRTEKSLTLTLGPDQWKQLYQSSSEENKGYLDLFMIPALNGESMTLSEYRSLLSSVYGPSIASEIVDSKILIYLVSPDGRKKLKISSTLGAFLVRNEEKSWSVDW